MRAENIERLAGLSEELAEIAELMNGEGTEEENAEISFTPNAPESAKEELTEIVIYFRRYGEGKRRLREVIPKLEEILREEKGVTRKSEQEKSESIFLEELGELVKALKKRAR